MSEGFYYPLLIIQPASITQSALSRCNLYIYVCLCVCVCVCLYVCICVYANAGTDIFTNFSNTSPKIQIKILNGFLFI